MSKWDSKKDEVKRLVEQGKISTEIAEITGIPHGSLPHLYRAWGISYSRKQQGYFSDKGRKGIKESWKEIHASGATSGENHWKHGTLKFCGKRRPISEVKKEYEYFIEQDLKLSEMAELAQLNRRAITAHLQRFGLQQGYRTGNRCPQWKGGHKKYRGSDWNTQRLAALERDNYTCTDCGLTNQESIEKFDRALHVHHIVPFCISESNELDNLKTVCGECHSKLHVNEYSAGQLSHHA